MNSLFHRSVLTLFLLAICSIGYSQRPSGEFIAPCGLPVKGLFLPIIQDSVYSHDGRFNDPEDVERICLEAEMICNEGVSMSLLKWLQVNPLTKVRISYHTDHRGDAAFNKKLSQQRAENTRRILIESGIESSRIIALGAGEEQFLISEADIFRMKSAEEQEKAHRINRRLEVKILEVNYKYWFGIADAVFFAEQTLDPMLADQFNRQYIPLFKEETQLSQEEKVRKDSAFRVLNILAIFLQTHPSIQLEIGVHTELSIESNYAMGLSQKRAEALAKHLISKGVNPKQLLAKGFGNKSPLYPNGKIQLEKDPLKKATLNSQNQRVSFILKKV